MVATGPRPRSSFASSTTPLAARPGVAFNSCRSAVRQIISSSRFRFVFFFAETSTKTVLPPHSSGSKPAIGQLLLHAIGHRVGLIDLVDRDDDRNFRGMRVVDRFDRLRHHAVIGSGDQHDNVGGLRAARTHAREGFVAGRIEEHDLAPIRRRRCVGDANFVGADVLGDSARFAAGNVGGANRVEQRRLAVIDVAHDGDDRRTRYRFRAFFARSRWLRPYLSRPALRR